MRETNKEVRLNEMQVLIALLMKFGPFFYIIFLRNRSFGQYGADPEWTAAQHGEALS